MAPLNQERNDSGDDAPRGVDKSEHANGTPKEGDGWLRSVVENSSEIVTVVDPDGTLRYANPAWERVLGHDPDEAIGTMNVLDHVHPDDLGHVLEETQKALAEGGTANNQAEYRFRHGDGSWRWLESVGTYLLEDPAVGGVVVTSRDITKRKEAEERFRTQYENFPLPTYTWRRDGNSFVLVDHNAAALDYSQGLVADLVGTRADELFSGRPGYAEMIERCFRERSTVTREMPWRTLRTGEDRRLLVICVFVPPDMVMVHTEDVTERKAAEDRLREAEERYRSLVETVPAVTYTDRAVGAYPDIAVYTSPRIEALVGYSVEEWLDPGRDLWGERLHPEDREWVLAADERSRATGEPFAEEYRLVAKDGRVVWVRDEAALMRDGAGKPLYWQGVLVDVTERKEAEEALREAERHFRLLAQNASDVVTLLGATGTIRYQSPSVERVLGHRPEEMIGGNAFDYVHPDDLERVEMAFAEGLVDPARRPSVEYRFRQKDGSWVWLESVGTNLLGDPGVGGYVVSSRDVSERKKTEERLRNAEARYRTMVERMPAVTYVEEVGDAHSTLYTSPQIEELLGYPQEEWLGGLDKWEACIYPGDRERVLAENARSDRTGEPFKTEYRMIHRDGGVVWVHDEAVLVEGPDGDRFWQGMMTNITERKALEERLEHQALHDPLTGLPNRRLFMDRLGHALDRTRRRGGVAVLFMDLDGFKVVNDSLGHEAGDLLLTVVAQRLRRIMRPEDTLARFGGDEFAVLLEDVEYPAGAVRVAERIKAALSRPFVLVGRELYAPSSVGVALGTGRTKSPDDLLRDADTAMYQAKEEGRTFRVFDPAMYERIVRRMELENDLRRAVERGEFVVHYQPIVDLGTGEVWGMEALVRWEHPERGLLNPDDFVPLAEETGLIVPMGTWVLEEACRQTKEWQDTHRSDAPLAVIVNLSARQLRHPDCGDTVRMALAKNRLGPRSLGLDVTESVFVDASVGNTRTLDRIKSMGVRVSIDDFGTGYSSLSYLKRLPADALKLDKTFVKGLGEDPEDKAIVRMTIEVAHTLGMEVVAEGVETEEQAALLKEMGCDMAQGYYFSEPLLPEAVPESLRHL